MLAFQIILFLFCVEGWPAVSLKVAVYFVVASLSPELALVSLKLLSIAIVHIGWNI